jgi:hypothetical protein
MSDVACHELNFEGEERIVNYLVNPEHRNNNSCKSQWIITQTEEIECFRMAYNEGWTNQKEAWGLHYSLNAITYLGIAENRTINLFVAKFKNDVHHNNWHGYPADYQRKPQDIPDKEILTRWMINNVLSKAKIRKIMAGQPCKP